jgi:DNA gyrase subunit A
MPTLGRATQGVRVMRLNEGDAVASIGILPKEEEEEEDAEAPAKAEKAAKPVAEKKAAPKKK